MENSINSFIFFLKPSLSDTLTPALGGPFFNWNEETVILEIIGEQNYMSSGMS